MKSKNVYKVAVVGGGIAGSAVAYFLSRHVKPIVMIEGKTVGGEGATSTSGGILRCYDNDERLREITYKGCCYFAKWEALGLPAPSPVANTGMTYLFRSNREPIIAKGIDDFGLSHYLSVEKVRKHASLNGLIRAAADDIVLTDTLGGYASPRATATQLAYGAVAGGCTLIENSPVRSLTRDGELFQLELSHGHLSAENVVLCLGSHFGSLLDTAEFRVRSIPLLHMHSTEFEITHPILDDRNSTYIRPIDRCNFYCGSQSTQFAAEPNEIPWDEEAIIHDAQARIDRMLNPALKRSHVGWVKGFDGYTMHQLPWVGPVNALPGLYVAMGFSGLGFKYSLTLGESLAADIIEKIGGTVDRSEFAADFSAFAPHDTSIRLKKR